VHEPDRNHDLDADPDRDHKPDPDADCHNNHNREPEYECDRTPECDPDDDRLFAAQRSAEVMFGPLVATQSETPSETMISTSTSTLHATRTEAGSGTLSAISPPKLTAIGRKQRAGVKGSLLAPRVGI
jgi:hypothetical protein